MKSVKLLCLTSAVALFAGVSAAQAEDGQIVGLGAGDILVHARAIAAIPDVTGHDQTLNGHIDIGKSYVPEVDASYFFTDYIAGEIIAGTTHHDVKDKQSAIGDLNLGHVWLLPPTVTAQLHPLGRSKIDPYVGAGINYSIFYGAGGAADILGKHTTVDYDDHFGYAFQAGVNYQVDNNWFVNFDVKKIYVSTVAHVKLDGVETTRAKVNVDPWIVGLGVGYRF